MEKTLTNAFCEIRYNPEYRWKTDCFHGRDLTDRNNDPSFYNTTVRGHKKAWQAVVEAFNDQTTMYQVEHILWDNGIKTHQWCAVD